jgi:hypothetical protein
MTMWLAISLIAILASFMAGAAYSSKQVRHFEAKARKAGNLTSERGSIIVRWNGVSEG